jgi:dUTP pyrophosphatase
MVKRTLCSFQEIQEPLQQEVVTIQRLSKVARLPTRSTSGSAGFDLYAAQELIIKPQQQRLVSTDLAIGIPYGYYGRVTSKSGLALCYQLDVHAGVIDADYRGNIRILLYNRSTKNSFKVETGDAIAQIIFEKIAIPVLIEVEDLDSTNRGEKGFGEASAVKAPPRP